MMLHLYVLHVIVMQSRPCPEGYICGAGTDRTHQFEHECAAGVSCAGETTPANQMDRYTLTSSATAN
jgi:hypothetical protein